MSAGRALWVSQHLCEARERIPCGRGGLQVASLVVVEVTCRSLACALELVVLRPECPADAGRGREGTGASADSPIGRIRLTGEPSITDSGCWADEGIGSGAL